MRRDKQYIPYACRHTRASRLVQRGVDIRTVKDFLEHASITTTMISAHLAPKDLDHSSEPRHFPPILWIANRLPGSIPGVATRSAHNENQQMTDMSVY